MSCLICGATADWMGRRANESDFSAPICRSCALDWIRMRLDTDLISIVDLAPIQVLDAEWGLAGGLSS